MAMSADSDLSAILPDIFDLGFNTFASEHSKAKADLERRLRRDWWPKTGRSGELNATLLTESQFTKCAAYLVLWKHALPKLTTWEEGDRFHRMIDFFKKRYEEEWEDVLMDGVEYDANDNGIVSNAEKQPIHFGRLTR
jgi:hypothetical protein